MVTVRIEHAIHDYPTWKVAFDRDPADRSGSGVRSYAIAQPVDDDRYVMVDLEFDDRGDAQTFALTMEQVWRSAQAVPALKGAPLLRVIEVRESQLL